MKEKKKKITVRTMVLDEEDLKNMGNKLVIDIAEIIKEAGVENDEKGKANDNGKNIKITIELG